MSILMMMLGGGGGPPVFAKANLGSLGTVKSVKKMNAWENRQLAYGGRGGMAGWNTNGAKPKTGWNAWKEANRTGWQGGGSPAFRPGSMAEMHLGMNSNKKQGHDGIKLGLHSQAYWDKYGDRINKGWSQEMGWQHTLTQAPASKSTQRPTQRFDTEVFQTLETRQRLLGGSSFQRLMQHARNPNLSPNLANMYKEATNLAGFVRKSTRRII